MGTGRVPMQQPPKTEHSMKGSSEASNDNPAEEIGDVEGVLASVPSGRVPDGVARLQEEADFYKRQAKQLQLENERLMMLNAAHRTESKEVLVRKLREMEHKCKAERKERMLMEERLTAAYNTMIAELLAERDTITVVE